MCLMSTNATYGFVSKLFHWVMAIAIIGLLCVGLYMSDMEASPLRTQLYALHKAFGATVLVLAFVRALWWLLETKPLLPSTLPAWTHKWVSLGHSILYAFMVLMPLSGWLMSNAAGHQVGVFGWFNLPQLVAPDRALAGVFHEVHEIAANVLIVLLLAHVGAALVHHFWFRDDTLRKMLPFGK